MVEKLVPKLRFNEFHDEWNTIFLNSILSFKNGFNASKDQYGFGTKFINVSDILENNYLTYDNIQDYVNINDIELTNYIIEYGDIVFQRSSENREEVGTANVYLGSQPCVYGGFVIRGKKEGEYNPFFLKELLQSTRVRKEITSWSGGSTRYNIGQDSLNKISIILPSIEEQNKIADLLLKVYEKIDLLEYKYQCYKNFKKYLMQQIFTQKLRFNFTDEWKFVKLETLIKKGKAGGTPSSTNSDYYNGDIPFLSIKDMTEQGKYIVKTEKSITNEGLNNSSAWIIPEYSLLYSIYASIGLVAINRTEISTSQAIYGIILKEGVSLEYMYYYLTYFKKNVHRYIETGTQGNLNAKLLKSFEVLLPSLKEQEMIVNILSLADEKIDNTEKEIIKMNEFKKGLLQQMFNYVLILNQYFVFVRFLIFLDYLLIFLIVFHTHNY